MGGGGAGGGGPSGSGAGGRGDDIVRGVVAAMLAPPAPAPAVPAGAAAGGVAEGAEVPDAGAATTAGVAFGAVGFGGVAGCGAAGSGALLLKIISNPIALIAITTANKAPEPGFSMSNSVAGDYSMKPRSGLEKRPRFGNTVGISVAVRPNHFASVALYSSTLVVGIQRPVLVSLGPLTRSSGKLP